MASHIGKFLLSATFAIAAGCSIFPGYVTVRGQVIDDTTSQPIDDALVVAQWIGHVSLYMTGYTTCYYLETTRTRVDGSFEIKAKVSAPPGLDERPNAYPGIVVYKPGYQLSLKRAQVGGALGVTRATFLSTGIERTPLSRTKLVRYLVPSSLDTTDRIRYLNIIARAAACTRETDSKLRPLLSALSDEASAIAKSEYDNYLVRRLKYALAVADGNKDAPPPTRSVPSVLMATMAGNASQLREALRAPSADFNERDDDDIPALGIASSRGKADLVRLLLDAGADPNKIDSGEGDTALHRAVFGAINNSKNGESVYSRYLTTIQLLLESPIICPDIRNIHGYTAREYAWGTPAGSPPLPEIVALIEQRRKQDSCAP